MKTLIIIIFLSPIVALSQIKIGDHYAGGMVYRVYNDGKHGMVVTDTLVKDSATYDEAVTMCKNGWRLPKITDWQGTIETRGIIDLITAHIARFNALYAWTADGQYPSSTTANAMTMGGNFSSTVFYRHTSKIAVLLVHSF